MQCIENIEIENIGNSKDLWIRIGDKVLIESSHAFVLCLSDYNLNYDSNENKYDGSALVLTLSCAQYTKPLFPNVRHFCSSQSQDLIFKINFPVLNVCSTKLKA